MLYSWTWYNIVNQLYFIFLKSDDKVQPALAFFLHWEHTQNKDCSFSQGPR